MGTILIIDRITERGAELHNVLAPSGHAVTLVHSLEEGLAKMERGACDLVLLNARLNGGQTLEVLPRILDAPCSPEAVIITETGDPEEAEIAIKKGAWDYLERSAPPEAILLSVNRALEYRTQRLQPQPFAHHGQEAFAEIIGSSPLMKASLEVAAQAAAGDAPVLISGETGTGKELFASAIHEAGSRARKNFVVVDCAALPENLVESILFGHEKGAFTGADRAREGLIKHADGGTLFLDEVGELPPAVQKSFLRVLQERRFRHLGGKTELESNFRIIAATNQDLDAMVEDGRFRQDLLFRLRAFHIELPPLRERLEDLRELAYSHLEKLCAEYRLPPKDFSPEFLDTLSRYPWPGNVRELFNALERALVAARQEAVIFPKHLPTGIRVQITKAAFDNNSPNGGRQIRTDSFSAFPKLRDRREEAIREVEEQYVQDLTALVGGDIQKGCQLSGLSRSRLYYLMKKYQKSPAADWLK
ncbi:MAG: sigma-54 dependent transcriptional regulator [Deltaproteobacteria bacterium]|nr:sigma-54 dependent transcriptional regulator [Deltaproteobacteria bacterium]